MIGYTMVGTKDLERALAFYDPIFAELGYERCWRDEHCASWGREDDESQPRFFTGYPFDGREASVGNGAMTAFLVTSPERIDRLYDLALENGGSDEGKPGLRPQYGEGFYAAYLRDPDGNKLAFVCYSA
ncbi:VOC family protein [Aquibaculum sediminis]|uniref:VOC family protein n=1 Tax=Aquibaculum sediminis TaxID=3231907 RepID=UPI003456BA1E